LQASSTATSTIQNANLVFNLDSTHAGAGNQLNVGNTAIAFNTTPGVSDTTLTLNLQGSAVIAPNTPYILVAGTDGGSANGGLGQYSGFTISGPNNEISGLTLSFGGSQPPAWYANSYLFLVNNGSNVDDIEVEVVPEPGTWAMMLGGLALLVFIQRQRGARNGDEGSTRGKL
jgi:PEP-CTERM motif